MDEVKELLFYYSRLSLLGSKIVTLFLNKFVDIYAGLYYNMERDAGLIDHAPVDFSRR